MSTIHSMVPSQEYRDNYDRVFGEEKSSASDEILGPCCECGEPCTDRDLVGNQIELGFPVLWCEKCINRSFEDLAKNQEANVEVGLGIEIPETGKPKRSCNRHHDCDEAEAEVLVRNPGKTKVDISSTFHCHSEDCEECFGY